jgi:hypothetical protein
MGEEARSYMEGRSFKSAYQKLWVSYCNIRTDRGFEELRKAA